MSEFTPEPQTSAPEQGKQETVSEGVGAWPTEAATPTPEQPVGADAVDPSAPQPASDPATGDAAAPSPVEAAGAPAPDAPEATSTEPAPDSTGQPTDGVVKPDEPSDDDDDESDDGEEKKEPPVQALSDLPPDADPNPAFHGEGQDPQAARPEPETRTAYSDDPAPFTVV